MSSITTIAMPHRYAAFGSKALISVAGRMPAHTDALFPRCGDITSALPAESSSASPAVEAATTPKDTT